MSNGGIDLGEGRIKIVLAFTKYSGDIRLGHCDADVRTRALEPLQWACGTVPTLPRDFQLMRHPRRTALVHRRISDVLPVG
ncbi:hypothetical protein J6590_101411 [Homalodisca vitripennis]|nr:hypothetical protein J6590_101411 [Homalodisca vitripennis]